MLFSFVEPSAQLVFSIDERTGEIRALSSFDFEQRQGYTFTIQARDNATTSPLSSTARFLVNITDVNDNAPAYSVFPASRTYLEGTSVGTVIATVSADDRDSGDNGAVSLTPQQAHLANLSRAAVLHVIQLVHCTKHLVFSCTHSTFLFLAGEKYLVKP